MRFTTFRTACVLSCWIGSLVGGQAQGLPAAQLDSLAARALRTFHVPGLAVAIVQHGQVVCAKGYGVRVASTRQGVDAQTLFAIASNSKAFTAAALGILVDEGKLGWDDKVIDYLPEFRLRDPWITADFTVRDLLTHRSGLAFLAGDLMRTPDSTRFTIPEIIHNLRYLPLVAPFRSRYAYDNILYLVAGELVARVSGQSWDDFIEQRLLAPLRMRQSRAAFGRLPAKANVALGHLRSAAGSSRPVPGPQTELDVGAGGIYSSAQEMSRWLLVLLGQGQAPGGPRLYSPAVAHELWTPQTLIPASSYGSYRTHFGAYGLGWFLVDVNGYKQVFHTGGDVGMISAVTLLPELEVGWVVLSNQEGGQAVSALNDQLADAYLGIQGTDHVQQEATKAKAHAADANQASAAVLTEVASHQSDTDSIDPRPYVGAYRDPWFGEIRISARPNGRGLWFQALRSPQLRGPLLPYRGTTFVARWTTPDLHADAFVTFTLAPQGQATGFTMQALSPAASPAFDFQDLAPQRVAP